MKQFAVLFSLFFIGCYADEYEIRISPDVEIEDVESIKVELKKRNAKFRLIITNDECKIDNCVQASLSFNGNLTVSGNLQKEEMLEIGRVKNGYLQMWHRKD